MIPLISDYPTKSDLLTIWKHNLFPSDKPICFFLLLSFVGGLGHHYVFYPYVLAFGDAQYISHMQFTFYQLNFSFYSKKGESVSL